MPTCLVRIPSVTGEEAAVQAFVAITMRDHGLQVDLWEPDPAEIAPYADHVGAHDSFAGRPNVVGNLPGTGTGRSLILNAHIDTVEPGDSATWTHPPFAGIVADGSIWGRGALDMKAGLATHLIALRALRDAGLSPRGAVHVQSVISEEDGGSGALATILRGYRADAAIITEPTNLAVVVAQGGSLVFRLSVAGQSAHACVRDEGISAIEKFALLHRALLAYEARRNAEIAHPLYAPLTNKVPLNIGTVRAGSWPSSVPEWLIAEGRSGLVPGEEIDVIRTEIETELANVAASDPWLSQHRPRIEWFSGQFAPAELSPDGPLATTIRAAHASVTETPTSVEGVTYGADMRLYTLFGPMPCLMYGAGDVRLAHHSDERILIDDVLVATKTIALAIADWCGV